MVADQGEPSVLLGELDSLIKDPKSQGDFSAEVQEALAKAQGLKEAGRFDEAIDFILPIEKKARNAMDGHSVSKICVWIVDSLASLSQWDKCCEMLQQLAKKRGQLKRPIVDMVHDLLQWLDKAPSKEVLLQLIECLCSVSEGKMFLEVERARIVMRLSKIKEAEGNLAEASSLLQEVQIETSISMDKHEKADYVLEQMRLVLARDDFVRAQIVSKRINTRLLNTEDFQMTKLRYYSYMLRYWWHERNLQECCRCFRECAETPIIKHGEFDKVDMDKLQAFLPSEGFQVEQLPAWYLQGQILFCILGSYTPETFDLASKIRASESKTLNVMPEFRQLLDDFLTQEIIKFPPPYLAELEKHAFFSSKPLEGAKERREIFRQRAVQHNLRVVAKYYKRSRLTRMAELFDIPVEEVEEELCRLISNGMIEGKINRSNGIVTFVDTQAKGSLMTKWTKDVARMLDIMEEAGHLLEKEKLLQQNLERRRAAPV